MLGPLKSTSLQPALQLQEISKCAGPEATAQFAHCLIWPCISSDITSTMSQRTFHKTVNFKFTVSDIFIYASYAHCTSQSRLQRKKKGNNIHLCVLKPHRKESETQPQCSINNNLKAKPYVMCYLQQIS